jgi:hypothetical protein
MLAAGQRVRVAALATALLACLLLLFAAGRAEPASASSLWRLVAHPAPTQLPPAGSAFLSVQAINPGDTPISAKSTPVVITDHLPTGIVAASVVGRGEYAELPEQEAAWSCSGAGTSTVSCTWNTSGIAKAGSLQPYENLELQISLETKNPSGSLTNTVTVEGGREAPQGGSEGTAVASDTSEKPLAVGAGPTPFGLEQSGYSLTAENEDGSVDTQAGSHPFQLTTDLFLNQLLESKVEGGKTTTTPASPALLRNLSVDLPPGLLGNVTGFAQCSGVQFGTLDENGGSNACPQDSAIGAVRVTIVLPETSKNLFATFTAPVFNLAPSSGEPARFGFYVYHLPVVLDTHVRTGGEGAGGGDYGVEVTTSNVTQLANVLDTEVTLWGAPGDARHDNSRGWTCVTGGYWKQGANEPCTTPTTRPTSAFLMLPTACSSSLQTTVRGESWPFKAAGQEGLGSPVSFEGGSQFSSGLEDCGALPFEPSIKLKPTTTAASTPTGLEVDVHVPQASTLDPNGSTESALRSTTVVLPEGVQLSPSAANGLEACSEAEVGYQGGGEVDPFSPGTAEPMRFSSGPASCPAASKVGTVTVKTPLLKTPLEGSVYLAEQEHNPFGSLVALYIVAEDPPEVVQRGEASGIRVKIAGEVQLNPTTGRITSTFMNTPQVPFEDFVVDFNSGPRASVTSPAACGNYTTEAAFGPWSGQPDQLSTSGEFNVTSGVGGSACASPQPFAPAFEAQSTVLQAGAFTPFALTITRPDGQQALKSVSVTLPPGAAAMLANATQCPEQQANEGTCGPESLIGHATAVSGLGEDPYTVGGGRVYITGPYGGGPFGLSIVTPAVAGPFNLGNVVVRSAIFVDRTTAQVTINTTLPTIVQGVGKPSSGIPLQLRSINVVVDRPNFEFNPTSCTPMHVTGTLGGEAGASAPVSSNFQVANCSALKFQPKLTAATLGNASKANGASLTVKIAASPGEANIAKTKLVIPGTLPSRLTTIQKACPDAIFEKNPAACDEGSNIGTATVHTPVLKSPLTGPAYLVSHGNAAFPDVEFVLQGEGVTLILDGQTDIKKGVTTSTFNSVPDAPINTFETVLPEGPHSAFTSNVAESKHFSLCGAKLAMPTTITGQNGVVITQQTNVPVGGCGAVKGLKESRSQKLAKALKKCRKQYKHSKKKRESCERKAHKKFGAKKKAKKKKASKKK